mmetsp:Transcript_18793/g.52028  ORF Transcript_18793/g.52028 Transcript_18793/m.52028 type:complete len:546 (-) Transcript_18793:172-1809(-)|eukprot:CAMPEP_0177278660 /NCGR_PEP_ID=MMETSP0367-20130122/69424_1 /TAXON_ID=447022 ORGANISM="Scrippsiella hangoei-like, Strain SHHI-4" /NCGR_SAMPLE_ID=MMETSP0367 /ASSEMBLY_ACC=CAM_ASM_000362 /LENGTH=545 /DNA_ID=CAMNT_0018735287 /DNA_START=20 /DNA_END=1657 /DNA_ORIENTATION=+
MSSQRLGAALVAYLALMQPQVAFGDLPVHCLRHQLLGEWELHLSGLSPHRTSCGHQRPDVEVVQSQGIEQATGSKMITLQEPNLVHTSTGAAGTFTMIYDEAFEVRVDNLTFFAFSRFEKMKDGKTDHSHCGETARGWYRDADRTQWGCYYGKKVKEAPLSFLSMVQPTPAFEPSANYDRPLNLDWHQERVDQLNAKHTKWTARIYDRFVGLSLRQLNAIAGIRRVVPREAQHNPYPQKPASLMEIKTSDCPDMPHHKPGEVLPHLLLSRPKPCQLRNVAIFTQPADKHTEAVEKTMPKSHDWKNFVAPVMDQSDCGSCYMVSTIRMLTARHRISTNNTKAEPWSISFPLHCSEYNQGCKGGYGFLASKWSEDIGLLPDSCAPYDTQGSCSVKCDISKLKKRWRAANHRYIGGFYGGSGAGDMMKEVFQHGPIVVSFEPSDEFMFYSGGVFTSSKDSPAAPLSAHDKEWQQVDHAVLCTGWGSEFGDKYWLVQNSWGESWGENGYFRIHRGSNEAGVESIAVAADVVEETRPEVLQQFLAENSAR